MAKEKHPNVRVKTEIRMKGEAQPIGRVIAKSEFAEAGEWKNLVAMERLEETSDKTGDADVEKAAKKAPAKKTPAKSGGMPGA